jgi:hypothetical protein
MPTGSEKSIVLHMCYRVNREIVATSVRIWSDIVCKRCQVPNSGLVYHGCWLDLEYTTSETDRLALYYIPACPFCQRVMN